MCNVMRPPVAIRFPSRTIQATRSALIGLGVVLCGRGMKKQPRWWYHDYMRKAGAGVTHAIAANSFRIRGFIVGLR